MSTSPDRKKRKNYSKDAVKRAVEAVKAGQMSRLAASKKFGVPYSTLGDKERGRSPMDIIVKTVLCHADEEKLAAWILEMIKRGFGHTREDIKDVVKSTLDARKVSTPFKNNRPGRYWIQGFLSRHKGLYERIPLRKVQAQMQQESLKTWFKDYKDNISSIDPSLLTDPDRLYSTEECGFSVCPTTTKLFAAVDIKHVFKSTSCTQTQVTALTCSSAAGEYFPPLLIFPYQKNPKLNPLDGFENAFYQRTKNGLISGEVLLTWLRDLFIPAIEHKKKPVVLFVDGLTSRVTSIDVSELCRDKGILLYCLHLHSSRIMQPLEQTYLDILKKSWSDAVEEHILKTSEVVTLKSFSKVFCRAWERAAKPELACAGFAGSGLFPFKPEVVVINCKLKVSANSLPLHEKSQSFPVMSKLLEQEPLFAKSEPLFAKSEPLLTKSAVESSDNFMEKLAIMEKILEVGAEEGLKNIKHLREGCDIHNKDFGQWTDLFRQLISLTPEPSVPSSPSSASTSKVSEKHNEKRKITKGKASKKKRKVELDCSVDGRESLLTKKPTLIKKPIYGYDDLQEKITDSGKCLGCIGEGDCSEWIQCGTCYGWWHVQCVIDASVSEKGLDELKNLDFSCEKCIGSG